MSVPTDQKIIEIMQKSVLFQNFSEGELHEILEKANVRSFDEGEVIVKEGDTGKTMYFIVDGEVEVFKEKDGEKKFIDILKKGDFFGEFSLFTKGKRHATCRARTEVHLVEFSNDYVEELIDRNEKFSEVIVDFYKIRVLDTLLASTDIFGTLRPHERKEVLGSFDLMVVDEGTEIVREGEDGDAMYVIKSGDVEVFTTDADGNQVKVAELTGGDFFGEIALITGKPRTATVKARSKVRLMKMKKEDFLKLCDKFPEIKVRAEEIIEKRAKDALYHIIKADESRTDRP